MVLPYFFAAASNTSLEAGQMSTPMPSPSIKGMIGLSGTWKTPSLFTVIFSAMNPSYGDFRALFRGSIHWTEGLGKERVINLTGRRRTIKRVEMQPRNAAFDQF